VTAVARKPRRGDEVEVAIARLDARGDGVGNLAGEPVIVRGALPGSRVRALVLRRRKGGISARWLATLAPGPDAVAPRCAHAADCGGCAFQGLAYEAQLAELGRVLAHTLAPLFAALASAGRELPALAPIRPAPEPFGYRNKMDLTFANRRFVEAHEPLRAADAAGVDFALGMHARGLYQKVIDVGTCHIAFPGASEIAATVRGLARERELAPWDVKAHTGLLRLLVLRRAEMGAERGAVLVNLVTSEPADETIDALARDVRAAHPEIATFVQTVQTRVAQIASGGVERVLFGAGFIEEELAGLAFRVSAASFFQTNTRAADGLARLVAARAGAAGGIVYDLCSGAGLLGLVVAARGYVEQVLGFELVEQAVRDARANAARNGVANARFLAGDVAETLFTDGLPPPDVCIADPPRAGLHARVTAELVRLAPPRVVYVSCNPGAAVRDLVPLVEAGYAVRAVEPLDLFPHTPHLECVFTLERA
jgi:23S rRNA (uracil1939-C5)-methyltransferase